MYVLHVHPQKEHDVKHDISKLGFTAFVPMRTELVRKAGKIRKRLYILFPGYVFLNETMTGDLYRDIKRISGVIRFLGGAAPTQLTAKETEYISWLSNNGMPLGLSVIDTNGNIISGPAAARKTDVSSINRRSGKIKINVPFAGEVHEVSLGIRLIKC